MLKKSLSVLVLLLFMVSVITGCGGKREHTNEAPAEPNVHSLSDYKGNLEFGSSDIAKEVEVGRAGKAYYNEYTKDGTEVKAATSADSQSNAITTTTTTAAANESLSNAILSQRKIIRNAFVSVEVENFDSAYGRIKSMISAYGFIQESNIKKDKVYIEDGEKRITRGTIIIRVDKDRFDSVMGDLKGLGTLLNENIKSDDVTDKFFDTESRLRLIKYEETRLEEYLKKTTDPDTIFKIEGRLTDIRHEIESLTGTLNKMTDLVQLSTITVEMSEKVPQPKPKKEMSYWEKLLDGFSKSFKGVINFCSELLLFIVQILPGLVLLGLVLIVLVMFYKRVLKNKFKIVSKKTKVKREYYDENQEPDAELDKDSNKDSNEDKG
ncbi:MAG TPA: DUF4349 domain-containing protein [Pseudobacteroides sp.]|uniref:DUF4349 domain-containing protein n=1 Tax=Pseudobacteroides sp. TaxID=1968840 RepID=UPI002F937770